MNCEQNVFIIMNIIGCRNSKLCSVFWHLFYHSNRISYSFLIGRKTCSLIRIDCFHVFVIFMSFECFCQLSIFLFFCCFRLFGFWANFMLLFCVPLMKKLASFCLKKKSVFLICLSKSKIFKQGSFFSQMSPSKTYKSSSTCLEYTHSKHYFSPHKNSHKLPTSRHEYFNLLTYNIFS
jgi:hypothetical protein